MNILRALSGFLCLGSLPLYAADPPPGPPPVWSGEGTLSYVQTGGNSDNKALGSSLRVLHQPGRWKAELRSAFIRAESDEVVTASKFGALVRGERELTTSLALYGQGSYLRDRFAGIDGQWVLEAGALYKFAGGPRHFASASAGLGYADEKRQPPAEDRSFAGGRLGLSYHYKLSASAELGEDADLLADLGETADWRANNALSLTASINEVLALKIGHQLAYIHQPVPGKRTTDTTFLASIVAKWPAK